MYGYLRNPFNKNHELYAVYKSYYCGLCSALKKNFGLMSTLLLSYDLTFIGIILSSNQTCINQCPPCCLYKKQKNINLEFSNDFWKKLSVLTLAIVFAKSYDNLLDDNKSLKTYFKFIILNLLTKNAQKRTPALFEFVKNEMEALKNLETKGCTIEEQGETFALFIITIITNYLHLNISAEQRNLIYSIMKWLCLIDAIDDYNSDLKANPFAERSLNPLINEYLSRPIDESKPANTREIFSIMCNSYYLELQNKYSNIMSQMMLSADKIHTGNPEHKIIKQMVYVSMPETFFQVIKGANNDS